MSPDSGKIVELLAAYGESTVSVSVSFAFTAVVSESIRDDRNRIYGSMSLVSFFFQHLDVGSLSVTIS